MKRKISLLILIVGFFIAGKAQVVLYEEFTAPFNPALTGWDVQNLSSTPGTNTTGWFQGTPAKLDALKGNPADYYAADMNSTSSTGATNTISCWLITPTVNLVNGAWLQFAAISSKLPLAKADRIQIYYSYGTGNNVGTTAGSATNTAGTFTNILMDYNATMITNFASLWTALTTSLTGITTPGVGRIGIRYYVPNGGAAGPNGNYIGIDEFRYSLPCARPQFFGDPAGQGPLCVGVPTKFMIYQANPTSPVTSYTWSNGATTSTTNLIPTTTGATAHWTLGETTPGCQALDLSIYFVSPSPTVMVVRNPNSATVCAGSNFSMTASGANSYTYQLSTASSSTINPIVLIAPNVTANTISQFTLTGKNTGGCQSSQVLTISVVPGPTLSLVQSPTVICSGAPVTFTSSGADTYTYVLGTTVINQNPATFQSPTVNVTSPAQLILTGKDLNGCVRQQTLALVLNPLPVVSAVFSKSVSCINTQVTATASGAATYSWSGTASSTLNPLVFTSGATAGVKQFTLAGTSAQGCKSAAAVASMTVSACAGIEDLHGEISGLSAYPNPFNTELRFKEFSGAVKIYNELGQVVFELAADQVRTIDTSGFPKGIYLVRVYSSLGDQKCFRLIKD